MGEAGAVEDGAVVAAVRAGDAAAFAALAERHRRELRLHCYRMLGSLDESEDLVQEALLRAWRGREGFAGRASFRAWLYRIATNACLDALARRPRAHRVALPVEPGLGPPPATIPWLQPYPDRLLEPAAPDDVEPPAAAIARETIELAFLATIQYLPPRQRAALILRDVLGWSAKETAESLGTSVASANSALQRARTTLKGHLPPRRLDWTPPAVPSEAELAVLRRYMAAIERADDAALAALLREDARVSHQPGAGGNLGAAPGWYAGRAAVIEAWAPLLHGAGPDPVRLLPTAANGQPAAATYLRAPGESVYRPFGLAVLRIEGESVVEVAVFHPDLFPAFGLPPAL